MHEDLRQRIAASSFLTSLSRRYPELNTELATEPIAHLKVICDELALLLDSDDPEKIEQALIDAKAKFAFSWSVAEFVQAEDFSRRGAWQTSFAELTIEFALSCAWHTVAKKHPAVAKALEANAGKMPGLFIFGMGKLGGRDLNFSSDVDLIAYFDPQTLPIPDMLGKAFICHQVLQNLTQILGQNGRSGFIWRVDWRLRPNASASTLAMSTEAAEEYYFFRASPWHRLALMKARVVAGDQQAGKTFLDTITPFIWRQNLDFRALDELAEIKQKINLEHPSLRVERQWREPISDEIGGYNVKLGSGGIREIEFVANALQLVWGGRHYALRTPNTLQALQALVELGQLDKQASERLATAYQFLRGVENGIQIIANQHTHLIPEDSASQQQLATVLGVTDWSAFTNLLNEHRTAVSEQFESMFADQEDASIHTINWPSGLSDAAQSIVAGWENGFNQYGVSPDMRLRLKPLSNALAEHLTRVNESDAQWAEVNALVVRLHDFFRSLPQGEQYFRLLAESPRLLDSMIPPLLYSPPMSTLLKQSPHIIDCYMGNIGLNLEAGFDSDYVLQADNYERRLERMRRFVNENLYQLYLLFMQGKLSVEEFQQALTDLANHAIQLALRVVAERMELDKSPIAVIGLGKLALGRMSPMSDLDLIFIFDPEVTSIELASKFVARLQTAIAAPMREGVLYELDTRLRPSGRSGAPTVSIESFAAHQLQRAHTWEHIALMSSKVVAGDDAMVAAINKIKSQVVGRQRDPQQFLKDARKMWDRVAENRLKDVAADVMFSKLRPGGLMQAEYLSACLILAKPRVDCSVEFDNLLTMALPETGYSKLPEITQFWRIQQLWERLLGFTGQSLSDLPSEYLNRLLSHSQVDSLAELLSKKQRYAQQTIDACSQLFQRIDEDNFEIENWYETNVNWLD